MKQPLLLGLASLLTFNASAHIHNFDMLRAAVHHGQSVSAHMRFAKCTFENNKSTLAKSYKDMETVMRFNDISYYKPVDENEAVVAASVNHFTIHHEFGPTNMFIRMRVAQDNIAHMKVNLLDPVTYETKQQSDFTCELGKGIDFHKLK